MIWEVVECCAPGVLGINAWDPVCICLLYLNILRKLSGILSLHQQKGSQFTLELNCYSVFYDFTVIKKHEVKCYSI